MDDQEPLIRVRSLPGVSVKKSVVKSVGRKNNLEC